MERAVKRISRFLFFKRYEKIYRGERKVKYLFFPQSQSDKLLVVFSAFPAKEQAAKYNYVQSFRYEKINRLYILDNFGPDKRGGSYYLAENWEFDIERSVYQLIINILKKLKLSNNDVISCGTSKGGYAALYYGLKYNFSAVIAGAPQTLLGDYLSRHTSYLNYITGGLGRKEKDSLNHLLFSLATSGKAYYPELFLHIGKGDHHYVNHIQPFTEHLKQNAIQYELDLQDYSSHQEVAKYFPGYTKNILKKRI